MESRDVGFFAFYRPSVREDTAEFVDGSSMACARHSFRVSAQQSMSTPSYGPIQSGAQCNPRISAVLDALRTNRNIANDLAQGLQMGNIVEHNKYQGRLWGPDGRSFRQGGGPAGNSPSGTPQPALILFRKP